MVYYEYWLDHADVLAGANDAWFRFYDENAQSGSARQFIGKRFQDWITGYSVQTLFATLLAQVRDGKKLDDIPFRCDSPGTRRLMSMAMSLRADNGVQIRTRVLQSDHRAEVRWEANKYATMCAWCNRIAIGGKEHAKEWMTLEKAIDALQLFEVENAPNLTHGLCLDCKDALAQSIKNPPHMQL